MRLTLVKASQASGSPLPSSHAWLATNKTGRMEDGVWQGMSSACKRRQVRLGTATIVASRIYRYSVSATTVHWTWSTTIIRASEIHRSTQTKLALSLQSADGYEHADKRHLALWPIFRSPGESGHGKRLRWRRASRRYRDARRKWIDDSVCLQCEFSISTTPSYM